MGGDREPLGWVRGTHVEEREKMMCGLPSGASLAETRKRPLAPERPLRQAVASPAGLSGSQVVVGGGP